MLTKTRALKILPFRLVHNKWQQIKSYKQGLKVVNFHLTWTKHKEKDINLIFQIKKNLKMYSNALAGYKMVQNSNMYTNIQNVLKKVKKRKYKNETKLLPLNGSVNWKMFKTRKKNTKCSERIERYPWTCKYINWLG